MIIDDVFSGLDAISEDRIFSRLLGKTGLLRQLGTTVLLVTHAAHRLSYADKIIALDAHGRISEQGKFSELVASDGYIAGLAARRIVEGGGLSQQEVPPVKLAADDGTARQNAAADLDRPIGSWAIYRFYLESTGWRNVGIWMGLMVFYSILLRFPGMPLLSLFGVCANRYRFMDQVLDKQYRCAWELRQWSIFGHTSCRGICSHGLAHDVSKPASHRYDTLFCGVPSCETSLDDRKCTTFFLHFHRCRKNCQ